MPVAISDMAFRAYIRQILIFVWDPIGVSEIAHMGASFIDNSEEDIAAIKIPEKRRHTVADLVGDMEDEYDMYIPGLEKIILENASLQEIYDYLYAVESQSMGRVNDEQAILNAARRLHFISRDCRKIEG